jgi:hypothetical protein
MRKTVAAVYEEQKRARTEKIGVNSSKVDRFLPVFSVGLRQHA